MSLRVLKSGAFDTLQDLGRYGFQYLGINPGGSMDIIAAQLANVLAGNPSDEAVIELHFPAGAFLFEQDAVIAMSGADFGATVNDLPIPINTPVIINKYATLQFTKHRTGARCYLSVHGGFDVPKWLNSNATHLKAKAGGFHGRPLQTNDELLLRRKVDYSYLLKHRNYLLLPWKADHAKFYSAKNSIRICAGTAHDQLTISSKSNLISNLFTITNQSDRMGYRLHGELLEMNYHEELVSSAVTNGTIQLLPNGQLIILMADHQTTGGYQRIAHTISADQPTLAQLQPNQEIQFQIISHSEAEQLLLQQHQYLHMLQNACTLRWTEFFNNRL